GVAGGSLGTASMDGNVRGKTGILDYALAASTAHSDGMLLSPNPSSPYYSPDRAPYQKHSWSARLGAQLDAADRIEFISLASHLNADFNTGFPPPYEAADLEDISTEKLSWSRRWSAALNTQLSVGQSDTRNSFPIFAYQSETRVRSYALEGSYALAAHQQLLFVLERREDRLNSSDIAGTGIGQRNENGAALGYVWSSGPLDVQAHARHDQDSEFGGVNTGNLGLGYKLSPNLKLIGSVSNAFRAPTLDENLGSSGPLSLPGGTSLLAETSHNSEVGLKYADSHAEWSVIAFRNKVENLINFSASTDSCASFAAFGGCYGNVQEARLQGLSFSGALQWDKLHLSGNLNLQAPKDLSTGLLLPRRAREFGALRAETQLQGWELGSTLQFAGRRYDDAANTMEMGGYALLNIDAGYRLNRDLKLQLNLDNAFNRAYQTAYNYNQLPRTLMVGLRYTPAIPAF
ncbi:MAG: TonB-dependent receptor, partial [Paucibacter sp.]|nr:TonB-dependent receptor [Roseateles sp.]